MKMARLRREEGASAVEFAIVCPLLFILVFGIIGFGIGFLQLQSARGAVREGARAAAVLPPGGTHKSAGEVQSITQNSSAGLITGGVSVDGCSGPGDTAVVSYNTSQANGGQGITVFIPFLPTISLNKVVSAQFLCEG